MQEKAHKPPTKEASETHEPPGGMPKETPDPKAQQSAPILDMQTALLLLLLLDRLLLFSGRSILTITGTIVTCGGCTPGTLVWIDDRANFVRIISNRT